MPVLPVLLVGVVVVSAEGAGVAATRTTAEGLHRPVHQASIVHGLVDGLVPDTLKVEPEREPGELDHSSSPVPHLGGPVVWTDAQNDQPRIALVTSVVVQVPDGVVDAVQDIVRPGKDDGHLGEIHVIHTG